MALEVNGAAILFALAKTPSDFGLDEAQLNALALSKVLTRLKDKAITLDHLTALLRAIGADDLGLALDHLSGKEVVALVKRFDPKNPDLRGSDESWQRSRLVALATGAEAVATSPAKAPRAGDIKPGGAKTGAVMKSKALKARPKTDAT